MPTVKVRNLKNEEVGDLELPDAVFGVELNEGLIHAAVKSFLASRRQGTVGTKTRGDVSGSGRKLWKQKGTGRARIASIRSPLWKGGGKVHGPQARDWSTSLPKKMRRGALRSALSERMREGNLVVLDGLGFEQPKTKQFVGVMQTLGLVGGKTLIVETGENDNLILSSRNIQNVKVVNSRSLNIYDVLRHEKIVMSRGAIEELGRALDGHKKTDEGDDVERNDERVDSMAHDATTAHDAEGAA
ncbi:MAG: 50S ribosomal protein L4 [Pyrinomonadaceae bacterium MAG19_C2-C3]|nr:50S ribosomal protein L4 [Pyrinomonadaceae bacterium MAG19_C2-C3]